MSMENIVAVQIPSEQLQKVQTNVDEIVSILTPHLIALTPEQRAKMPKMADGTEPFVMKALDYARSAPGFLPPFVKVEDAEIDYNAVQVLTSIYRPLQQLVSNLEDTIIASGSEAYIGMLSFYHSVKLGSRMNAKGAKPIYNDLKKRFEGQGRKGSNGNGSAK